MSYYHPIRGRIAADNPTQTRVGMNEPHWGNGDHQVKLTRAYADHQHVTGNDMA
jgi:hypothetical protein